MSISDTNISPEPVPLLGKKTGNVFDKRNEEIKAAKNKKPPQRYVSVAGNPHIELNAEGHLVTNIPTPKIA